ncbi:hypothetical protein C1I95_05230 [Micromonospora craterilacus]|uniref:Uncharacterized protein n=1 Tax=Micromonospora craterilacus TaxID=1655439 RepID=A0A2W2EED0_9ACTN|nr:hypothetical protein [Micromonospora craterilacus]PZG22572.1 hypothetical protein C1I95_05230 [Micromonospora craterilacus]
MSIQEPTDTPPPSRWSPPAGLGGEGLATVAVGDVIRVPEEAYLPGTGELLLYVAEVIGRAVQPDGHVWAEVNGHAVKGDGTLQIRSRYARVRVDRAEIVPSRAG